MRWSEKPARGTSWKGPPPDKRDAQEDTPHPALDVGCKGMTASNYSSHAVTKCGLARSRKPTCSGLQGREMESTGFFDNSVTTQL